MEKWSEDNFDIQINRYVKEAYESKKFMYVSDYARLLALYRDGGIYLDVDCLVKKDFSSLLKESAFTGYGGDNREIAACTLGFEKEHPFLLECLQSYEDESFVVSNGESQPKSVNIRMTEILQKHGFEPNGEEQTICGVHIYPMTYFCPLSMLPDEVPDCKSRDTYSMTIWSSPELKRERSFPVRFAHKTGLNKVKQCILRQMRKE